MYFCGSPARVQRSKHSNRIIAASRKLSEAAAGSPEEEDRRSDTKRRVAGRLRMFRPN